MSFLAPDTQVDSKETSCSISGLDVFISDKVLIIGDFVSSFFYFISFYFLIYFFHYKIFSEKPFSVFKKTLYDALMQTEIYTEAV